MFESYRLLRMRGWRDRNQMKKYKLKVEFHFLTKLRGARRFSLQIWACKFASKLQMCRPKFTGFYSSEVWFLFFNKPLRFISNFTFGLYFPSTVTLILYARVIVDAFLKKFGDVRSWRALCRVHQKQCNLQTLLKPYNVLSESGHRKPRWIVLIRVFCENLRQIMHQQYVYIILVFQIRIDCFLGGSWQFHFCKKRQKQYHLHILVIKAGDFFLVFLSWRRLQYRLQYSTALFLYLYLYCAVPPVKTAEFTFRPAG